MSLIHDQSALLAAGLMLAFACRAEARVFQRWGAAGRSTRALEESGGRVAYASDVTVNGGRGTLTVFRFDRPLAETVSALSALFAQRLEFGGGSMASGEIRQGGRTMRLTLLELNRGGQTLVFKLEQPDDAAAAARGRGDIEPLKDLPAYPSARTLFTAADERSGFRMAVSGAGAGQADVQAHFAQELPAQGWAPAPGGRGADAMRLYSRGADLCIVQTSPGPEPGQVRITVLHKKQRTASNSP